MGNYECIRILVPNGTIKGVVCPRHQPSSQYVSGDMKQHKHSIGNGIVKLANHGIKVNSIT